MTKLSEHSVLIKNTDTYSGEKPYLGKTFGAAVLSKNRAAAVPSKRF